ncbi:MAG: hypothetical protein ABH891_00805 [Candidatus Omnitrophota bacterium]
MNMRNLNQIHSLAKYPMTTIMARAWFLSTKCRLVIKAGRHAVRGRGLLRTLKEDLA